MKTSRFTGSQILAILKQAEGGLPVGTTLRARHERQTPYDDGTTHVVRRRPHSAQWSSWGAWQRLCPD